MESFPLKTDLIQVKGQTKNGKVKVAKYDRSFLSRVVQDELVKYFYDDVKNYCLAFENVKAHTAWNAESFSVGKETIVRLTVVANELCICLALDPAAYSQKDYPHADWSGKKDFATTPTFAPIRTLQELKIARRLIAQAFVTRFIYTVDFPQRTDYVETLPDQSDEELIEKSLIKVSESEMSKAELKKATNAALKQEKDEEKELEKFGGVKRPRLPKKPKPQTSEEEPVKEAPQEAPAPAQESPTEESKPVEEPTPEPEIEEVVFELAEPEPEPVEEAEEEPAEESTEEPVEEPAEEPAPEPVAEEDEAPAENNEDKEEDNAPLVEEETDTLFELASDGLVIEVKYDRSFLSRIIQNEKAKEYYSEIKNYALSFGVKPRLSWKAESFYLGRNTYLVAKVRGKTLNLFLALDPKAYEETVYHQVDVSDKKTYEKTPMMLRVKSDLGLKKAKKLIEEMLTAAGLTETGTESVDYVAMYPYEETDALIEKKLIKRFERHLDATESAEVIRRGEVKNEPEVEATACAPAEKPAPEEAPAAENEGEEDEEDVLFEIVETPAEEGAEEKLVTLKKLVKGFAAKMKQGDQERKDYYAEIKAKLLSYKGVRVLESFSGDGYKKGMQPLLKSRIRGKTLCLFFALDTDSYKQTVYRQQYKGDTKAYAATPMMVRVKSEQGLKRALRLIEELEKNYDLKPGTPADLVAVRGEFLFEETEALVERGLIKTRTVTVTEAEAERLLKKTK